MNFLFLCKKNDKKTCQNLLTTILVICIMTLDKESCHYEKETCQQGEMYASYKVVRNN